MQFCRPAAQLGTNGQWQDQAAGTTAMHLAIDEAVLDSGDYMQAGGSGIGGDEIPYEVDFQLSSAVAPISTSGFAICLYGYTISGGNLGSVELRRISTSTVVHEEFNSLTGTPTLYTFTLTAPEVAALAGGYDIGGGLSDFGLKFTRIPDSNPANIVRIEQAYLELPDAGFTHLDIVAGSQVERNASSGAYLELNSGSLRQVTGIETTNALLLDSGSLKIF